MMAASWDPPLAPMPPRLRRPAPGMLRHEQSDAQVSCCARGIEVAIKRAIKEFGIDNPPSRSASRRIA